MVLAAWTKGMGFPINQLASKFYLKVLHAHCCLRQGFRTNHKGWTRG